MAVNNRDYLNVIERKIIDELRIFFNTVNSSANDGAVNVVGQFPEPEELKFPSVVIQQVGSGLEEQFIGEQVEMLGTQYSGEILGVGFLIHIIIDKEVELDVGTTPQGSSKYRQRRLLNWMMLNIANVLNDIDWTTEVGTGNPGADPAPSSLSYNPAFDASVDVQERHLQAWRDVGFSNVMQWWGATAQYMVTFLNYR